MNREQKKHEETYVKAHHKQVVLKPLTEKNLESSKKKHIHTHYIQRNQDKHDIGLRNRYQKTVKQQL